jgi:hypothetical protein
MQVDVIETMSVLTLKVPILNLGYGTDSLSLSLVSGVTILSVSLGEYRYNVVNRPFLLASAS